VIQLKIPSLITETISLSLRGLGGVIQTGNYSGFKTIPYDYQITGWNIYADVAGSVDIAFWKDNYANFPPTSGDNVFSTNPFLSSAQKNQASGLSIAGNAGDIWTANVNSATLVTRVDVDIFIVRI
jgi:hypothetical protein